LLTVARFAECCKNFVNQNLFVEVQICAALFTNHTKFIYKVFGFYHHIQILLEGVSIIYNCFMIPAIFLDRDGVIIENRTNYIREWSHVAILPKAVEAIVRFQQKHLHRVIIITNQSAIGRGLMTFEAAQDINARLVKIIEGSGGQIEGVYMCPHKPDDLCDCRKPQPGLFFQAARELSVDLRRSWMIGDAWSDLLAGQAAGLSGLVMVKTGRGAEQLLRSQPETLKDYHVYDDISKALSAISFQDD
jgi:D-glycero-D-manno-heptose 1,7-bisphosphate phosphatase